MAEQRPWASGQDSCQAMSLERYGSMADRIDPPVQAVQPTTGNHVPDGALRILKRAEQLPD